MRRMFVISLVSTLFAPIAFAGTHADEGRVGRTAESVATDRKASYTKDSAAATALATGSEKKHAAAATKSEPKRPATITMSEKSAWFRIYDASAYLRRDRDGDGHHSEFEVRFDADSYVGDARVYAKLYLRRVGDTGGWQHYHTTDDFWIFGARGGDEYYVTTVLDDGFPTGDYDVLIDLYESGYSGIVATYSAYDDASLASLPLEERGLDIPFGLSGYSIGAVSLSLLIDDDRDGYFSRFRVSFDPDSDVGATVAYAVVWVRPRGGEWIKEHESDDFIIDNSGTADAYSFTADWLSGYPTSEYDLQLDLYDSSSGLLIASAGSERPQFSRIPLEDASRDRAPSAAPVVVSSTTTTSYEHGGGSLSMGAAVALLALLIARSIVARNRKRREVLKLSAQRRAHPSVGCRGVGRVS